MPFELDGCKAEMKAILSETLNIQDPKVLENGFTCMWAII